MARRDLDVPKKKITLTGLKNLWKLYRFLKPYRLEYAVGILFLFGSSAANLAFPKFLGDLVNVGSSGHLASAINRIALILGGILLIQAFFSFFRIITFVDVTEKTLANLRHYTYDHLIRLPLAYIQKHRVGELNSRISSDITLLQDTLTTTLAEFIRQIIIIIGGITLLVYTSARLTLFMLAVLPGIVLLVVIFGRFIRKFSKDVQRQVAESNTIVEETLQGIQSVKSFTNEFLEIARYRKKVLEIARIGIKSGRYRGMFNSFTILGIFGAMVAVIWKGSQLMASGDLQTGELFSFVIYSGFIGGTVGGLADVLARIQKFIGATEDLLEIFDAEEEPLTDVSSGIPEEYNFSGAVKFSSLTFAYPSRPDEKVLNNISFTIAADQLVALAGPSGAGKTTIASLLLRLYDPTEGNIYFDQHDSRSVPMSVLRNQIALVPQDIFLFGGSIRENIDYGKPGSGEEEIIEAARKANAWEFISRFPQRLDTVVGERGTQLSGGQRQRIAIARAVLKNPRILILDEATSSLDSESERLVQDALEKLMMGRTSIIIAHRLSTIRKADQILVFEKGKLVEKGTHDQLLQLSGGLYRNLSELQFAG